MIGCDYLLPVVRGFFLEELWRHLTIGVYFALLFKFMYIFMLVPLCLKP